MKKNAVQKSHLNSGYRSAGWHGIAATIWLLGTGLAPSVNAIDITTENNPPFNYANGEHIAGISTEMITEMGHRAGVPLKIQILPWARAYLTALNTPATCVYSTARLPEQSELFKWIGPIATNKWALFARADASARITALADARGYRIGGVFYDGKYLYLKSLGFTNFELVSDDDVNAAKLIAGRIDLWITGLHKGTQIAAQHGSKSIKPVLIVRDVEYYLACNLETPEVVVNALSQSLQALQNDGHDKTIIRRYARWLHP
ncbi:MAG: transporter substrate-binding domain-containing protein [Pseudomonadota bacterium]